MILDPILHDNYLKIITVIVYNMDSMVQEFINVIDNESDLKDKNLFWDLVNNIDSDSTNELEFVRTHPEVLTRKIGYYLVFDYFYEKVIGDKCHPSHGKQWHETLVAVIDLLDLAPDPTIVKNNKKYILKLQSTCRTLISVFHAMIQHDFDMGDPEFLVYSIIARGELHKLEILSDKYVIEDYPGVLDVALRFGRHLIIQYFMDTMQLDIAYYGKILDFENYVANHRYLYYKEHIVQDRVQRPVVGVDYISALNMILGKYIYPVTSYTIDKWCELIRSKECVSDTVNHSDVLGLLVRKVQDQIPLTHDFKEFNTIIFGKEWSDRTCLIEYCMRLEEKVETMTDRHEVITDRYNHLQTKYDSLMSSLENRGSYMRGNRIRRETS